MTIHHSIQKAVDEAGWTIQELPEDGGFAIFDADDFELATEETAKAALAAARAEAERLANEDDEPKDQTDAEESDEQEDDEEKVSGGVVPARFRQRYADQGDPTSCGDEFAEAMKAYCHVVDDKGKTVTDLGLVIELGHEHGVNVEERWSGLNPGMKRMNLGNVMRAKNRKGEELRIGSVTIPPYAFGRAKGHEAPAED